MVLEIKQIQMSPNSTFQSMSPLLEVNTSAIQKFI